MIDFDILDVLKELQKKAQCKYIEFQNTNVIQTYCNDFH